MLDSPKWVEIRREQVSGPPDRMILGERFELVFFLRKNLLHQLFETLVKLRLAATRFGENKTSLLDVFAQISAGKLRKLRRVVAVEVNDRGLKQLGYGGDTRLDDLPGQEVFPVAGDNADNVSDVVGIIVPVTHRL